MRRRIILLSFLLFVLQLTLSADVTVAVLGEDVTGSRKFVLENRLLKASFSTLGGRLVSLIDKKSGRDFVWDNGKSESGAFKDQFPPAQFEFRDSQYSGTVLVNTPEKGVIVFLSLPLFGKWQFLTIKRTYTLLKNECILKCELEILNRKESMTPKILDYWQHNFFGVKNEKTCFFVPTAQGITSFVPSEKTNRFFFREPVRGWIAMLGQNGGGVALMPEYKRLDLVYSWWCRNHLPLDTLEWRLIPEEIREGRALKTVYSLGIIHGLKGINGTGEDGCGQILLPSEVKAGKVSVKAEFCGFAEKKTVLRLFLDGKLAAERKDAELRPEQRTEYSFELNGLRKGVYELILQVLDRKDKTLLFDLLAVLRVDHAQGEVAFSPLEQRIQPAVKQEKWQFDPSPAVVTPHYKWLTGNKEAEVLFLVPTSGIRDVIEMKQRMPLHITAPTVFPGYYAMPWRVYVTLPPGSTEDGTGFVADYLKRQYQAIVIGSEIRVPWEPLRVRWDAYPSGVRRKILDQVRNGAGMVFVNPAGEDADLKQIFSTLKPLSTDFRESMDFSAAPYFEKTEVLTGHYGKGRIVVIRYPVLGFLAPQGAGRSNDFQTLRNDHRYQEYQFAILCRLLNWALGENPILNSLKLNENHLVLESRRKGTVAVDLFDRYTQLSGSFVQKVNEGKNIIPVHGFRSGKNYVHVRFGDRDFGFASYDARPADRIRGIALKPSYEKKELVKGRIKLSASAEKKALPVKMEILDQSGRIVYRQNGQDFLWDQRNAVVNRHTVRARLLENGRVIDEFHQSFNLPEQFHASENFTNLLWAGSDIVPEYSIPYRWEAMRRFGFNFLYAASVDEKDFCNLMRLANMEVGINWVAPLMFHSNAGLAQWEKTHDKKYLIRPQCPNNPAQWDPATGGRNTELFHDFGSRHIFQLGDEMSMTYYNTAWDVCFCDYCKKDFRKWLQKRYSSLDALNREWKTGFPAWDAVVPMTRIEIMMHDSPAPWVEHRIYMDDLFARTLAQIRDNIRKKYPGAAVGPTGVNQPPHVYGGNWNFWKMSGFDCASIYGTGRIPLSFNRDKRMIMQLRGYTKPEAVSNYTFWEGIFAGERNTNNWYEPIFVLPDLRESENRQYYKRILWELRSGIGDLLYHSSKITDQVAILHSHNSLISNFIKQKKSDFYAKELSFAQALEDSGIAYRFIAPEELKSGILQNFKALILPEASALGDDEILAVRQFAERGGILIADYEPAIQNEVCNTRKAPALNDLFGISTRRFSLRKVLDHDIPGMNLSLAGSGVKVVDGKNRHQARTSKGVVPLVVEKHTGRGKAVFLNFVTSYNQTREHCRDRGFLLLLNSILNLESAARVESEIPVMHAHYRNGANLYIALLPVPPDGQWERMPLADLYKHQFDTELHTETKGWLYDARKGMSLGYGNVFRLPLVRGDGTLLALLPYQVRGIRAELPDEAVQGEIVKWKASVICDGKPGHHVLLMTVEKPDGGNSLEYRMVRNTRDGHAEFQIPFAFNDPAGKWTITLKDAASGVQETRSILLK